MYAVSRGSESAAVRRAPGSGHARYEIEHDPLMWRYFRGACLSGKEPAKRCALSHTRIYVGRAQRVRSHNAGKISCGMAHNPDLSEPTALELMGVEIP
jgi:hypothetical protein